MVPLKLHGAEIAALRESQNALLSVLDHDRPEAWQLRVNRAVKRLIGADHSVFSIPDAAGGSLLATDDSPEAFRREFLGFIDRAEDGELEIRDPAVREAARARIEAGSGAYHMEELGPPGSWRGSAMYNEVFAPHGFPYMVGLSTPLVGGEATQFFGFGDRSAPGYGRRGIRLLDLLVPSFESAIRLRRRVARARGRLAGFFDALDEPVALYSGDGLLEHRSGRLRALLAGDPAEGAVMDAADALARSLVDRSNAGDAPPLPVTRRVTTPAGAWRISVARAPTGLPSARGAVVLVEPLFPQLPDDATLRHRFDLSSRQATVARLMARGLGDREIAERLSISWHTARRHARDVLRALDLSTRAAVAMTLMDGGRPDRG